MPEKPPSEQALAIAKLDDLIEATERQIELLCFARTIRASTGRDGARLEQLALSSERRVQAMIVQRKKLLAEP